MEIRKDLRKRQKEKQKLKKQLEREQGINNLKPSRKLLKKNKPKDPGNALMQLIIDLNFEKDMSEKDLSSCISQLQRIYQCNRRASTPIPIHFTNLVKSSQTYVKLSF